VLYLTGAILDAEERIFGFLCRTSLGQHFSPIPLAGLLLGRRNLFKNDVLQQFLVNFW